MVVHFKATRGVSPVYEITKENVEEHLGRIFPWLQVDSEKREERHYAVCPYCENPIQLIGLYRRQDSDRRPYGRHVGSPVNGFEFNPHDLEFCPYRVKNATRDKNARRPTIGPVTKQMIDMAISEFDRVILILRDDFGFRFSNKFAGKMLDQWFKAKAYLYPASHPRNLPWMIAYFSPALNLFGQPVGTNPELAAAIRKHAPNAAISTSGYLVKGREWCALIAQCLHHKVDLDKEGTIVETIEFRVRDTSKTNVTDNAPRIFAKEIVFLPDRFERLMNTPPERAQRDAGLLNLALEIAAEEGFRPDDAP